LLKYFNDNWKISKQDGIFVFLLYHKFKTMSYNTAELLKLPVMDRYDIALALWESIESENIPVSKEEREFAEMRLEEYRKNPKEVIKWEDARAQIKEEYGI
jgi:putative addiction module component (TIGR02574 family)